MAQGAARAVKGPQIKGNLGKGAAHPVRVRAFRILNERIASPKEIFEEIARHPDQIKCTRDDVIYHVGVLRKMGRIEEVSSRKVRGATEHFYRAVEDPWIATEDAADMTLEEREDISRPVLEDCLMDIHASVESHLFDALIQRVLMRNPVNLDLQGYVEMEEVEEARYEKTKEIAANVERRRREDPTVEVYPTMSISLVFPAAKGRQR